MKARNARPAKGLDMAGNKGGSELEEQQAQEERERERKQQLRNHINSLYGIQTPGAGKFTPLGEDELANIQSQVYQEMGLQDPGKMGMMNLAGQLDSEHAHIRRAAEKRQADMKRAAAMAEPEINRRISAAVGDRRNAAAVGQSGRVQSAMDSREKSYSDLGDNVRDYHLDPFNEEHEKAARQLKFRLADAGQIGGSLQVDKESEFGRLHDRGLREIDDIGTASENAARQSDEQSRLDLLTRVDSGMDSSSAISAALSQLATGSQRQLDAAKGANVSDVFGNMGYLYQQDQVGQGRKAARDKYTALFDSAPTPGMGGGSGYQGTTVRS